MSEMLRVEKLTKNFGSHAVLRGIDLSVSAGETVCVIGASGSGKSTLLRCLNFLELPTSGRILLEGRVIGRQAGERDGVPMMRYREAELNAIRARVGMVFQQFNLFPHLTVQQNVALAPVRIRGLASAEAHPLAEAQLARVGLADKRHEYPARLSGGQQQRAAIARALAMEPHVMLFDEATSALDPELVGEVLQTMRQLAADGMTMVVVTHELGFAYNVANRVVFLHDGLVHEEGPTQELMHHPKQQRTREFLRAVTAFKLPDNV
jgi:polar amino acid transport system ATP-binding protein